MGAIETTILLAVALVTSTISGVLGAAGGVTLISVMAILLPASQVVPLHGIVQLVSSGTRTLVMRRYISWRYVVAYAPLMAVGVWLATLLWSGEKMDWFRPAVGLVVLFFLFWRRRVPRMRKLPLWIYPLVGLVIGFLNIFVGATGPLVAPFFLRDDFTKEEVIGTQAACFAWGHLLKVPAFISLGFDFISSGNLLLGLLVCVICGTLIGKFVLHRISAKAFIILFELLLGILAVYLIGSWLYNAVR